MKTDMEENGLSANTRKQLSNLRSQILSNCPDSGILNKYVCDELSENEKIEIEEHVDACPECLLIIRQLEETVVQNYSEEEIQTEYEKVKNEIDERIYSYLNYTQEESQTADYEKTSVFRLLKENLQRTFGWLFRPQRFALTGFGIAGLLLIVYSYGFFSRPWFFSIAQLEPEKFSLVRGDNSELNDLSDGISLLEQGKYSESIQSFSTFIKNNPTNFQANYYTGLAFLYDSEQSILGLSYKFDQEKINRAIHFLTIALTFSQDNIFYQEDCYWYLGKAYLRLGNLNQAKIEFINIIKISQPNLFRKEQAKTIIETINKHQMK